jgi:Meckel syndrome type 1 protein
MSDKPSIDRELDAFLSGEDNEIARIYKKLPQSEPDARLDAAVLAMARGAVEPQRRAAIRHARAQHRLPGWMIGIGTAAGFVFAAGLAWQLRNSINPAPGGEMRPARESNDVINVTILAPPPPPPAAAPPSPPEPAARAAAPAAAQVAQDKDAMLEKLEAPRAKPEVHGVTEYTLPGGSAGRRPQPAPFSALGQDDRQERGNELDTVEVTGNRIRRVDRETAQPTLSLERDEIGADAKKQSNGKLGAPREEEIQRRRDLRAQAKEKVAAAPPAANAAAVAEPKADAGSDRILPVNSAGLQRNAKLPPDKWLLKIRELLQQNKRDEAIDNIDYFRAKYPSYPLPDDLRKLSDESQ